MDPVFEAVRAKTARIAYAEGEDERVLEAVQQVVDGGLARPILIGRRAVIEERIEALALRYTIGEEVEVAEPASDPRAEAYAETYYRKMGRRGVSRARARHLTSSRMTVFAACMVEAGDADGMICGSVGPFDHHLQQVRDIIGKRDGVLDLSTMSCLITPKRTLFVSDTHVTQVPSAEELAEMTLLAADEVRRFGKEPAVALLSHSNFGSNDDAAPLRMREALAILRRRAPELNVDGEMQGEAALSVRRRLAALDTSTLHGEANLLIMPNREAAHISFSLLQAATDAVAVGPILLGVARPVNVVHPSITVRGLVNMTVYTAAQALANPG